MRYCSYCRMYVNTKDTIIAKKINDRIEEKTIIRNCRTCGKFVESVVTNEWIFGLINET